MDWADDVTYSVHDLDDFFRAGVIPLDRLVVDADERNRFYVEVFARRRNRLPADLEEAYLRGAFDELVTKLPIKKPYQATEDERIRLRSVNSTLIGDYVRAVGIERTGSRWELRIEKKRRAEIFMLKQLTWHYVIANPALATQQEGQRTIIRNLFRVFFEAAFSVKRSSRNLFPVGVQELLPTSTSRKEDRKSAVRIIIDFIAGLTEEQAVSTCHRLTGVALGSSLIHRVR